jgi:NAD+ kinase
VKLECTVRNGTDAESRSALMAMNEINVHMGRINSAVRFKFWVDDELFRAEDGEDEIIGDGFLISTPFGSSAYYRQITRGVIYEGLGVAFKLTTAFVNHAVVPQGAVLRAQITRGPAILAVDNRQEFLSLKEGDEIVVQRHATPAILLTWDKMRHPTAAF